MISVTIDTSVFVGMMNSRSRGSRLLELARLGRVRIEISEPIVSETTRVLRDAFHWNECRIEQFRQTLLRIANHVAPRHRLDVIAEDPSDNRILECAVEAGSSYILSWDRDLLRLGRYGETQIVTVPAFLAIVPTR